jgi:hypothetical protein
LCEYTGFLFLPADIKRKGAFEMKNRKFIVLGMLAVMLVSGLVLAGCDNGGGGPESGGDNLNGTTWIGSGGFVEGATLTLNYPKYEIALPLLGDSTGTYTVSGNTVTFTDDSDGEIITGTISGNTMTLSVTISDMGTMPMVFNKKS